MSKLLFLGLGLTLSLGWLSVTSAATTNPPVVVEKIFLPQRLQIGDTGISPVQPIDDAAWIWHPDYANPAGPGHVEYFASGWREPVLLRFRKEFTATDQPLRIHVSADERFELFCDGQRIARGPDRSDVEHWCYATYDLQLAPGPHQLEAVAWSIGPYAPVAQLTWRGGFILKAEGSYDDALTTGKAAWEVAKLDGIELEAPRTFVGAQLIAHGCGAQWKEGQYVKAKVVRSAIHPQMVGESAAGWKLFPTRLPDQIDRQINTGKAVALRRGSLGTKDVVRAGDAQSPELPRWQAVIAGQDQIVVPAHTEEFLLWDLGNYYTAYPLCEVSGGAGSRLALSWAESLYLPGSDAKGQRD